MGRSSLLLCLFAAGCAPSLPPVPPTDASPRSTSSDLRAQAGSPSPDPRVDPSVFEVEDASEAGARRAAEQRCGLDYQLVSTRVVTRTATPKCGVGALAHGLSQHQTTRSNASAETCTPATSSRDVVFRFRCGGS
ncbi:MAG: hypothetical protein JST00_06365 [Deltaproteobacteria bacterium]|nr:hypothetical protein [Deltaproteobacteria bacterium]